MKKDFVVILNFGSQFAHLICRRLNELNVPNVLIAYDSSIETILSYQPKGIIFSGGPNSVYKKGAPLVDKKIFDLQIPILGICYGMQTIAAVLNSPNIVSPGLVREYSNKDITLDTSIQLFKGIRKENNCLMNHTDQVKVLPDGFKIIASTSTCKIAAMANISKNIYSLQFHPEAPSTYFGTRLLSNFLFNICKINKKIDLSNELLEIKKQIFKKYENTKVVTLVSGLKSAVLAYLVNQAIGKENNLCLFIDNGLISKENKEMIFQLFDDLELNINILDRKDLFIEQLSKYESGIDKRKAISELMYANINEFLQLKKISNKNVLLASTYDQFILGAVDNDIAQKIIDLPMLMNDKKHDFYKYFPFKNIYRDELINILRYSKFPSYVYNFKTYPTAGIAIRIMGKISKEKINIYERVDALIKEVFYNDQYSHDISEIFPILLDKKIIGEMGDCQVYKNVIILRSINIQDSTTFAYTKFDWKQIDEFVNKVVGQVTEVSHVVYDVTSAPPSIDEWE